MKKYDIFISYRRNGGFETAKHFFDLLKADGYRVSFDIDTLRSGPFDKQLLDRIKQCKDFLLIVDKHTFDRIINNTEDDTDNDDWLRKELAFAIKTGKNIIPILLAGVENLPDEKMLPEDVKSIHTTNCIKIVKEHFDSVYEKLKNQFLKSRPVKKYLKSTIIILLLMLFITLIAILLKNNNAFNNNNSIISNSNELPEVINVQEKTQNDSIDKLDLTYIINSFTENIEQAGSSNAYWSVFSKNELLSPVSLDREDAEEGSSYSYQLEYHAKLRFNGQRIVENDAGQEAFASIKLLGANAGPTMLEISFLSGGYREDADKVIHIPSLMGYSLISSLRSDELNAERYLFCKDNHYLIVSIDSGSGGYFISINISDVKSEIDYYYEIS